MRDIKEIEEELSKLNDEYIALRVKQDELLKEKRNFIKEKLKVLIGKYFYNEERGIAFLVTSVSKEDFFKAGESFNPYQIPIYSTNVKNRDRWSIASYGELTFDTIFSRCNEADDVLAAFIDEGNVELTSQEFKTLVDEAFCAVIDRTWENCE